MNVILRREWRSVFHSLSSYLFMGGFALLCGIIMTVFHFSYGYTNFEFGLPYYATALALVLPILTVCFFRPEKRGEGIQLLRMLPLSAKDWILGKLWCLVCVWGVICGVMAILPPILGAIGGVEYPSVYLGLLVLFLFGLAFIMIEAFISVSLSNRAAVWIVSYSVPVLLVLINNLADLLPWMWVRTAVEYVSLFGAMTPFVFSLVDIRVPVLYGSVAAVFGILAYRRGIRMIKE
ncbi:MAG: hypothetical protein IJY47_07305 [Clostridia bacterium]|nr:hypothetical protein [Clostridia bacterium]